MAETLGVLEAVGKVAGVGGLAIAAMVFVFRDLIKKVIFPTLGPVQSYRLLRLIVICVSTISIAGLITWAAVEYIKKPIPPTPTTEQETIFPAGSPQPIMSAHLKLVDSGAFEEAWDGMAELAHKTMGKDQVISAFNSVRPPLGRVVSRQLKGTQTYTKLPNGMSGAFSGATYVTKFSSGKTFIEVLYTVGESGHWKMMYHTINACAAPFC